LQAGLFRAQRAANVGYPHAVCAQTVTQAHTRQLAIQLTRQYRTRTGSDDMAEDSESPFVPIVNEDGEVTGVMDQMTADFLASTDPEPTQATLDKAFEGVTRVRLMGNRKLPCVVEYDGQQYQGHEMVFDVVRLDVADPASLTELAAALRIVESGPFGHVMSLGEHLLELWMDDRHVHTIELLPGWDDLRWPSVWNSDAPLAEPKLLKEWVRRHRISDRR
jgi:hypothetical protein